jgi:Protein of unknown function (DUF3106)
MNRLWKSLNPEARNGKHEPAAVPAGRSVFSSALFLCLQAMVVVSSLAISSTVSYAEHQAPHPGQTAPAPKSPAPKPPPSPHNEPHPPSAKTQHLGDWLATHQNLPPAEQEKALQREPGFSKLPPEQQQRLENRLRDLNNKTPEQRQRTINRVEAWERMSPAQKQQVANSTAQLRALPPDRQLPLRKAFRDLRDVPPDQRQAILNSSRFQAEFSPHERGILSNLLTIEPYQPNRAAPAQSPPSTLPIPAYR